MMEQPPAAEQWPLADHDAFLSALHDRLRNEADPEVILAETTQRLALHLSASRTGYGEFDAEAATFIPRHHWTDGSVVSIDDPIPFDAFGPAIVGSHRAGELWVHETLDDPKLDEAGRAACAQLGIVAVITVPVLKGGKLRSLISVQQSRPRHWHREDVALVVELADRTWALLERARAEMELERSREALYQSEKMMALGSLLAGVSHELNNPLSIVVAQAELMELEAEGGILADRAQKIRKAAERCARIVQTFLAMARQQPPERRVGSLNTVVAAAHELTAYGLRTAGITTQLELAPRLPEIAADFDQLHQIVVNLIVNAQQAMAESRSPERMLTLRTTPGAATATVALEIADTGPGIPDEIRRRIFEPFFTTKPHGEGTGIGLSFSQGLAEAHGGRLELVQSSRGACFRLTLPVGADARSGSAVDAKPLPSPPQQRRALVIDDEPDIADALADLLSLNGFRCDLAIGGRAAQEQLAHGSYDIILSDVRMPDLDGPRLYDWLNGSRPELVDRLAFVTGDTLGKDVAQFLAAVRRPVLEKPFTRQSITELLQQVTAP